MSVGPAEEHERASAVRQMFGYLPADALRRRVETVLAMIDAGELDPAGLLVARTNGSVSGAMIAAVLTGRGAALWPPVAANASDADELVNAAVAWLRAGRVCVAQALVDTSELSAVAPLLRNGFAHPTALWYLRHELELATDWLGRPERLTFVPYPDVGAEQFAAVLAATYQESLDCPEVAGARTPPEAVAAHRLPETDERLWWLAERAGDAVGVLLVNPASYGDGWDVAYVGVLPNARRRGHGRELMRKALFEAKAANVPWLGLSVDARNAPARTLYKSLGFEPIECKEVILAVWPHDRG